MYQTVEKRYQMRAEGINISAIVVLTTKEQEILECKDLENCINNVATDLHVAWAVEVSGNVVMATISKQYGPVVGDVQSHEVEIAAANFMSHIRDLELPKHDLKELDEPKSHNDDYDFVKKLVDEWDETEERYPIAGFIIMARIFPEVYKPCGNISSRVAKEMCMCYLKVHAHDKK